VAVRGGVIVAVRDAVDQAWIGPDTRVLDLAGATVVPGLWDAHGHVLGLGLAQQRVDLAGTRSFAEVIQRVQAAAADLPDDAWIQGRGWDQNDWPEAEFGGEFPAHAALSAAVPDHPVVLRRIDGHASLLNAAALAASGIAAETRAPEGGEILRSADGTPTGVLVDAAMGLVQSPPPTAAQVRRALKDGAALALRHGLVGVHDAGVSAATLAAYEELYAADALDLRVYALLTPGAAKEARPRVDLFDGRLTVRAVKRFMDGALGSRGAYLLAPYSDAPETQGLPQQTTEELAEAVGGDLARGLQTCTHAIGDGGVRRVLDAYARALKDRPGEARLRVEHAQVIAPEDIPRFAALGVVPSMQPTHATSDMPWAEARLGPERVRGAYAWRALLDAGVRHLPLGSDFPVESVDPRLGLYAAVTRLDADGGSPHGAEGWYADQALTRREALRGFTLDACAAAFQEHQGGTIEVGKRADFTVFGVDPLTCPPAALLTAPVRATIVGGRVAYEAR
jgi:predicted amidohydrolase YtcJ